MFKRPAIAESVSAYFGDGSRQRDAFEIDAFAEGVDAYACHVAEEGYRLHGRQTVKRLVGYLGHACGDGYIGGGVEHRF